MGGLRDTEDQLDACRAQSIADEHRLEELERETAELRATLEGTARQNAELEHDLARAESALADRLQHDAHVRPSAHTFDREALGATLNAVWAGSSPFDEYSTDEAVDAVLALLQPAGGVLLTPEEAALAVRACRHSADSIRSVYDIDPDRLHPAAAGYVSRLDDLADRLQAAGG